MGWQGEAKMINGRWTCTSSSKRPRLTVCPAAKQQRSFQNEAMSVGRKTRLDVALFRNSQFDTEKSSGTRPSRGLAASPSQCSDP